MTKLQQFTTQNIPAGLFICAEAFWYQNEKWVLANGTKSRFSESTPKVQQTIWKHFLADKQSHSYLAKMGVVKVSETFDRWYRCVVGGLDSVPDFLETRFEEDAYNNLCNDHTCPPVAACAAAIPA